MTANLCQDKKSASQNIKHKIKVKFGKLLKRFSAKKWQCPKKVLPSGQWKMMYFDLPLCDSVKGRLIACRLVNNTNRPYVMAVIESGCAGEEAFGLRGKKK